MSAHEAEPGDCPQNQSSVTWSVADLSSGRAAAALALPCQDAVYFSNSSSVLVTYYHHAGLFPLPKHAEPPSVSGIGTGSSSPGYLHARLLSDV